MRKYVMPTILSLFALLTLFLLWQVAQNILAEGAIERPADARLLFIGNSFTGNNELDQLVANLMSELGGDWDDTFATRIAPGGYTIEQHLLDAENSGADTSLSQMLVSGSDTVRDWNLIVIQEQSQILGFGNQSPGKVASFNAAPKLHQYASDTGAAVMILSTWGYIDGDPRNASIFPDYVTMQNRLTQGANDLATRMSANGSQVVVIPAGRGFRLVYQDMLSDGQDPLAQGSFFRQLYAEDAIHPSLSGSYLAASIVTAVYTQQAVSEIDWAPQQLDENTAAYLRRVADRVVFGN